LEQVLERVLQPLDRVIFIDAPMSSRGSGLSAKTAFLLSRLDGGLTLENALDVAGMPRMEALHALIELEQNGMIRLHRDSLVRLARKTSSGAERRAKRRAM
jgi:hypothetical protein